ncbi:hypothetical protein JCM8547_008389 [Rhodosporidiobolus lusitaniae]
MGVRDLTAVVKKHAPSALKPVTSLRSFAGARFAIDAQLLSTKFFFAAEASRKPSASSTPFKTDEDVAEIGRRLAKSWYFFLIALRKERIRPIVVFDGETRVREKEKENERRRKARELQKLRGLAEGERGSRLREIRELWAGLAGGEKERIAAAFRLAVERQRAREREVEWGLAASSLPADDLPAPLPPERPLSSAFDSTFPLSTPSSSIPTSHYTLSPPLLSATERPILDALVSLYLSFLADSTNPIYSRNQGLVTVEERAFFESILTRPRPETVEPPRPLETIPGVEAVEGVEPAEAAAAVEPVEPAVELPAGDVAAGKPPIDIPVERAGEAVVEEEILAEELDDIIQRSDKLGASHTSRGAFVPKSAFNDVRALVEALGIPFLEPHPLDPHEAEGVCSALCALELADYVVSEDTDVAVYGAKQIRRVMTTSGTSGRGRGKGKEPMAVLDPAELREKLGLTKEEFVDFALLCGTDFTERIPFVGPAKALSLIRQHSTIERILEHEGATYEPVGGDVEAYLQTVRDARSIFLGMPQLPVSPPSFSTALSPDSSSARFPPPTSFTGSLEHRQPSPDLPALLKRLDLRWSRYLLPPSASRLAPPLPPSHTSSDTASLAATSSLDYGCEENSAALGEEQDDGEDFLVDVGAEVSTLAAREKERRDEREEVRRARKEQEARMEAEFERIFL